MTLEVGDNLSKNKHTKDEIHVVFEVTAVSLTNIDEEGVHTYGATLKVVR